MNRLVLIFICNFLYIYLSQALYEKREAPSELSPQRLERFIFPFFRIHRIPHDIDLPGCPPDHFACNDGKCVEMNWKCDGIPDCKDGEDEANCKYSSSSRSNLKCSKHEFKCKNNIECIPQAKFCDAKEDCQDRSDEYDGCVNDLPCDDKFRCSDRHCVIKEWVCDGSKDCPDGSDEWNCKGENRTSSASDCKIENYQYFCGNQRCISLNAVCNKKDDCGDGSDEGAGCTPSKCPSSVKCDHECKQTPKGSICLCRPGYKLQNDNRTCIDINECQTYGICDQECVNSQGSYNCMCQKDYVLQGDKKTCKAHAGEATIVFSTRTEIVGMYLDSKITFKIASNLNHAVGVAMNGDDVYWSNFKGDSEMIVRKIHNSKEQESIATTGLSLISGIAVDWITENIYFTDMGYHRIGVCNNNGMYCTVLINDTDKPAGIVLLPTRGEMYWCDWGGSKPHISVAGMNGKNIRIFVSESLGWPKSMTIDYPNDRLYWVDAKLKIIESIRLDGTDRRLVLHDIIQQPFSLAIFENKLYWSDEESKTIESCNKFTGKDWQTLYRINEEHQPYSVHIDHSAIKPKINNPCHFNPCSELCMLNQDKGYTCACTMDKELSTDNHSCRDVKQNKHLLVVARRGFMFGNMGNMFITYYHQMLGKPKLITNTTMQSTLLPARAFITDVTSDPTSGEVIISYKTSETEILVRYDPVGNNFRKIMSIDSTNFQGIAFDYIGNNLYMTNAHNNTIMVRNMKTEAMTEFYFKDLTPQYVTLVPEESKMYVVFQRNYHFSTNGYVLYEMNMNGLGERKLIRDNMTARIAMCYDRDSKTLFVSEELAGRILSYSVAEGIRILGTGLKPASLAVAGDNIFWAEDGSDKIFWTDFKNTFRLNQKKIAFHVPDLNTLMRKFVITLRKDVLRQDHDCQKNNGHCSHVCLLSSITSFTCACPPGLGLSYDNRTCIAYECSRNEYKCRGHNICISKTKLCDGIIHCPNGEDETVNCHEKQKCKEDDFMCKNGECISSKDRCNSHYDCADQSDEEDCKPKYDEFFCLDGTVIPKTVVCDGESDCIDGEDEAPERCKSDACQHEEFRCDNGNCISSSLKCDGIDDCHDGSDEWNCLDTKTNYSINCTADEYNCLGTKLCLPKKARCNGVIDCMSHDDEFNCPSCFDSEFTCDNGKCIPKDWVCDNRDDCNDNSDEDNCDGRKKIVKESDECYEFKCSNGACLPYSKTCDDIRNCQDGSDEDGKCNNACAEDNICKDMCYKTPKGAVCGCQIGYRLAADAISCEDINECKDDVCSQICNNTEGSYMCSCYEGYIIRNDKVSCKAIGPGMEFVTVTDYDIRMISSNFHSVDKIFSLSRMSKIEPGGLDVNAVSRSVYWSNSEYGTINKFSIKTEEITAFAIVERPHALAVDWITDNVYVYDNSRQNTIKVCNLEQQRCVTLVEIKDKEKIGFLLVDAVNRWLFWSQMTCQMSKQAKSCSTIYRTDLMGVDMKIIGSTAGFVTGITIDYIRSKLYWSDDLGKIESSNLDGSQRSTFLNTDLPVLAISIYEQKLYWLNQKAQLQICYLYGRKSCDTFNFGTNNFHSHFTILHVSRQPIAKNPCDEESCDYMCVLKKDNATCVCSDGEPIGSNRTCMMNMNSEPKLTNLSTSTRNASGVYSITIIVLLVGVLLLCVYYYYQKTRLKLKSTNDLSYSNIRFQNPSYDRRDEVEVTLNSVSSELAPGQHEYVNPIDDKVLRMKAATESRRKSDQYSEEKDAEETEKQDASLIYFFQSK